MTKGRDAHEGDDNDYEPEHDLESVENSVGFETGELLEPRDLFCEELVEENDGGFGALSAPISKPPSESI